MPYPSGLSIFDPTDEQLAQYGYNRKLQPDEKIQWIGTPNLFWFWYISGGRIILFGGLIFFGLAFSAVLFQLLSGALAHNPNKAWGPFLPFIVGFGFMVPLLPMSIPRMILRSQIFYLVTNRRLIFTTFNQEGFFGLGLFWILNRRLNETGEGAVDVFYDVVSKIFTDIQTRNLSNFWFSDFVDLTGKPLDRDVLSPERKYNFRWTGNTNAPFVISTSEFKGPAGGVFDRFIAVEDGPRIAEILEANCALVKSAGSSDRAKTKLGE